MIETELREQVALAPYTTMRVGGHAEFFVRAEAADAVVTWARWASQRSMPYSVLGHGSNVIVPDEGLSGLVIIYRKDDAPTLAVRGHVEKKSVIVSLEGGASLAVLSGLAADKGFAGLEWACGIPGTVGGAVAGNAGAYGGSMAGILVAVNLLDRQGNCHYMEASALQFDYRESRLLSDLQGWVVLGAEVNLKIDTPGSCRKRMLDFRERRRSSQPTGFSAGCVFRNPPGLSAGALVDACGLRGTRIGGAMISERHGNYIINESRANAIDVVSLMNLMRRSVKERFGLLLQPEVRLLGSLHLEEL